MRKDTIQRKKASKAFNQVAEGDWVRDRLFQVMVEGKKAFDSTLMEMGRMLAETIFDIERVEKAGPDYFPSDPDLQKWASQPGSVFIGDQKVKVQVPRLRSRIRGEVSLQSYHQMRESGQFSEELLQKALQGISAQKYGETVIESAKAFGVSPSSVSKKIVQVGSDKLREFKERDLSHFRPFAVFLDTIHRGGEAFIVALGVDLSGSKIPLGFWEGATENSDICKALLNDIERRGVKLVKRIIWVTDGGSGVIKALKDRFGKKLLHQRCTIHKDRNIQRHLNKKYRKEAHFKFRTALEQTDYKDAKEMLLLFEKWLRARNESAADSLLEALEEILTLHRLKIPALLRKSLHSTNPIESMFSTVRELELNIKRYRGTKMMQRWLATTLLYCESRFRKVKGFESIDNIVKIIEEDQAVIDLKNQAAA